MSQEECEKVTAKPTAILPDKPLYKTTNPNSEHEAKKLLSSIGNAHSLVRCLPDALPRPLACHLHGVALVVGGIHQHLDLASRLEGERVEQRPAVTGVDLPRLGMAPMSRHPGEHGVWLDRGDSSHHAHTVLLERLEPGYSAQEQASQTQESDKKDDAWIQHQLTSSGNKPFPVS